MNSTGWGQETRENAGFETDEADFPGVDLNDAVQETIGRSLKAHYDEIAREPIPDRFLVLLAQLEAQETKGGGRDE